MKHFIFDMGGVIAISMNRRYIYDHLDLKISYEEFKYIFSDGDEAIKIHKGEISLEEYFEFLKKYMDTQISFQEFIEIYKGSKNGLYENTVNIIKRLKSKNEKVYLLSNLRKIDFDLFSEMFDVNIFDKMYLSYELNMVKPNDDIYQYVIKSIGDDPTTIVFFDDNEANVKSALSNGINAYKVTGENIKDVVLKTPVLNKIIL